MSTQDPGARGVAQPAQKIPIPPECEQPVCQRLVIGLRNEEGRDALANYPRDVSVPGPEEGESLGLSLDDDRGGTTFGVSVGRGPTRLSEAVRLRTEPPQAVLGYKPRPSDYSLQAKGVAETHEMIPQWTVSAHNELNLAATGASQSDGVQGCVDPFLLDKASNLQDSERCRFWIRAAGRLGGSPGWKRQRQQLDM